MLKMDLNEEESRLVKIVMSRSKIILSELHPKQVFDFLSIEMDVVATHLNGCPLNLEKFAAFKQFDLLHDLGGIRQHLDRVTGELENNFLPRCSA